MVDTIESIEKTTKLLTDIMQRVKRDGYEATTNFLIKTCHENTPIADGAVEEVQKRLANELKGAIDLVEAAKYAASLRGEVLILDDDAVLMNVLAYRLMGRYTIQDEREASSICTAFLCAVSGSAEERAEMVAFNDALVSLESPQTAAEESDAARHTQNVAPKDTRKN